MEAILGLCLYPLDIYSAFRRPVWVEGNVFSLSLSDFSIPWALFYNSELIYVCRMGFVNDATNIVHRYYFHTYNTYIRKKITNKNATTSPGLPYVNFATGIFLSHPNFLK
jgi:hypothetical protein